jgi:hypothetical protein
MIRELLRVEPGSEVHPRPALDLDGMRAAQSG